MKIIAILLCLTPVVFCNGQVKIGKSMVLKDSTLETSIPFIIHKGIAELKCTAESYLSRGELSITIYDPEGKREGGFKLYSDSDEEPGAGRMTHEVQNPIAGTWKMQITITHATGKLEYKINSR